MFNVYVILLDFTVYHIRSENYRFWAKFFAIEIIRCYKFCRFLSISIPNFGFFGEKLTLWLGLTGNHDFIAKNQPVVGSETMAYYSKPSIAMHWVKITWHFNIFLVDNLTCNKLYPCFYKQGLVLYSSFGLPVLLHTYLDMSTCFSVCCFEALPWLLLCLLRNLVFIYLEYVLLGSTRSAESC